ncbi:MAG: histidine phosphatase family protein, partial [Desulfobacterales bacterium]|nr:histidine phosphatase family protein [Desulfobacterales bacterium]
MCELWFIRHGQASFGASNYDKLSGTGIRQCEILGAFFSNTGRRFARVYSGRMVRQIDTAKIVMSHVNGGKE